MTEYHLFGQQNSLALMCLAMATTYDQPLTSYLSCGRRGVFLSIGSLLRVVSGSLQPTLSKSVTHESLVPERRKAFRRWQAERFSSSIHCRVTFAARHIAGTLRPRSRRHLSVKSSGWPFLVTLKHVAPQSFPAKAIHSHPHVHTHTQCCRDALLIACVFTYMLQFRGVPLRVVGFLQLS